MGLFDKLHLEGTSVIDWEMTPEYTFGTFESWGGKERVRSGDERIYYFFIDDWGETPRLCLMERGIRHAKVVAEFLAPQDLIAACVAKHGKTPLYEKSLAIDAALKQWLIENVIETTDDSKIIPLVDEDQEESLETDLPGPGDTLPEVEQVHLPTGLEELAEEDIVKLVKEYGMFDSERNPEGEFTHVLVDNHDGLTVSDQTTGLMWQRGGIDIMSHRMMKKEIERLNTEKFAGYADWRQPSLLEAMSLMIKEKNEKDQYLHSCFSKEQPFVFVAAVRKPGGYWFVDFKQGKAFWSSGTIPGGFGRLCRTF